MPAMPNLDLDLLRAFVAVADSGSFTRAAEQLLRNQSTVSLQLKRLEEAVDRRLLERSSRKVRLTAEGGVMLDYARRLLALNDEVVGRVREPKLAGKVRLGTPEDFATTHLPHVLARFAEAHPRVDLEVTCDLTFNLLDRFRHGAFDLVLVKREPSRRDSGVRVWREPLVWVTGPRLPPEWQSVLPLALSPPPCVYRKRATQALNRSGRRWRIAYTCAALSGTHAAVRAGLGLTVLPKDMVPAGLTILDHGHGLPDLHHTEIALLSSRDLAPPVRRLREHIVRSLESA
jgi:DNA-binding transcriptional LysR family regulator